MDRIKEKKYAAENQIEEEDEYQERLQDIKRSYIVPRHVRFYRLRGRAGIVF